jgi:tRNA dimethylallyltransferase
MLDNNSKPKIIVVLGPTSSGKSDLAVTIAQNLDRLIRTNMPITKTVKSGVTKSKEVLGEVISADSRQIYKGLDIGTGKITKKEMKGVPHHLLDVASPKRRFTASDFKKLADKKIEEILKRGNVPIICGGTGFYIDALLGQKNIPEVPPNEKLRKELQNKSTEELFSILKKLDPERARTIDSKNPRRLVRAIEICEAIGKVPRLQIPNDKLQITNKFKILKIGIKISNEELRERINKRLEKRIKQGMIEEAKKLHKKGLSYKRMRELGLEYGALADLLENKITKVEMTTRLQTEIWQYAKRQITYFKKDKSIVWVDIYNIENFIASLNKIIK